MTIQIEEPSAAEKSQWRLSTIKVNDILLLTEPVWVSSAVSFVYLSVIASWPSYIHWLFLIVAFSPFLLRLIRYGRPGRRTPFDIPIVVLLCGMIVGMAVSDHFDVSLGAFQTFLAATAFYYSVVNYSKPSRLITIGLSLAAVGGIIALIIAMKWASDGVGVRHGLYIALFIIGAIALGISIFTKRIFHRVSIGLFGLILLCAVVFFSDDSLRRLFTLVSVSGRMQLWLEVITPIKGSLLWTGLGLGDWGFTQIQYRIWLGHVHNAYLELYINTGVVGLVGFGCFLVVGAKLSADILYSPRNNPYYGFGAGVILAALAVLAASFLESAPFGFGFFYRDTYHYILTPIPFILAGLLVVARRLLRENSTVENTERAKINV